MESRFSKPEGLPKKKEVNELPNDHWFSVTKELYKDIGREPDPLQIRERLIIDALKIPSGQTSAIETDKEGKSSCP